jgi:hypothetical protein
MRKYLSCSAFAIKALPETERWFLAAMLANPIGLIRHYGQRIISRVVSNGENFCILFMPTATISYQRCLYSVLYSSYGLVIPNPTKDDLQSRSNESPLRDASRLGTLTRSPGTLSRSLGSGPSSCELTYSMSSALT